MPSPRVQAAAALLLAAALAAAPAGAGLRDGAFVQLYTGLGLTEDSELRLRVPADGLDLTLGPVSWEDYSLSRPSIPYVGFRVGRWSGRRPWLGLALDVIHYKVFARTERRVEVAGTLDGRPVTGSAPLGRFVERYNIGNGVNLYLATLLVRQRRGRGDGHPDGRWRPYAGLGLGAAVLYTSSTIGGESRRGYEAGRAAIELLAGVEVELARRFALFGEVKRSRTTADGSVAGGDSETRLDTSHLVVGASYRF